MSELIKLPRAYGIEPQQLLAVRHSLPRDRDYYVPIKIFGRHFREVDPILLPVGERAVSLALEEPFGFMKPSGDTEVFHRSQKTAGIIVAPDPDEHNKMQAELTTIEPLTELDYRLFREGIDLYIAFAAARLKAGRP